MKHLTKLETLLSLDRLGNIIKYIGLANNVPGAHAEFGVFRGGGLEVIAKFSVDKQVFGIDSFAGLPKETKEDFHREGDFNEVDYHALAGWFKIQYPEVRLARGFSPEVFSFFSNDIRFAFVHVDVDLYESVRHACDFFYPRMSSGGIMVFDDYGFPTTPGAKKAVDEFFKNKPNCYADPLTKQYIVIAK